MFDKALDAHYRTRKQIFHTSCSKQVIELCIEYTATPFDPWVRPKRLDSNQYAIRCKADKIWDLKSSGTDTAETRRSSYIDISRGTLAANKSRSWEQPQPRRHLKQSWQRGSITRLGKVAPICVQEESHPCCLIHRWTESLSRHGIRGHRHWKGVPSSNIPRKEGFLVKSFTYLCESKQSPSWFKCFSEEFLMYPFFGDMQDIHFYCLGRALPHTHYWDLQLLGLWWKHSHRKRGCWAGTRLSSGRKRLGFAYCRRCFRKLSGWKEARADATTSGNTCNLPLTSPPLIFTPFLFPILPSLSGSTPNTLPYTIQIPPSYKPVCIMKSCNHRAMGFVKDVSSRTGRCLTGRSQESARLEKSFLCSREDLANQVYN